MHAAPVAVLPPRSAGVVEDPQLEARRKLELTTCKTQPWKTQVNTHTDVSPAQTDKGEQARRNERLYVCWCGVKRQGWRCNALPVRCVCVLVGGVTVQCRRAKHVTPTMAHTAPAQTDDGERGDGVR